MPANSNGFGGTFIASRLHSTQIASSLLNAPLPSIDINIIQVHRTLRIDWKSSYVLVAPEGIGREQHCSCFFSLHFRIFAPKRNQIHTIRSRPVLPPV